MASGLVPNSESLIGGISSPVFSCFFFLLSQFDGRMKEFVLMI